VKPLIDIKEQTFVLWVDMNWMKPPDIPMSELLPAPSGKTFPMSLHILFAVQAKIDFSKVNHHEKQNSPGKTGSCFFMIFIHSKKLENRNKACYNQNR
jgi:hypothetical protein